MLENECLRNNVVALKRLVLVYTDRRLYTKLTSENPIDLVRYH